ncbi:hypothetical protein BO94DRAFT_575218 [Aspergillus sclerotioniger CBS 115572]|uniref:F-box domain-containing protein n=1 Tax=Aspergillus sclerotioniger CBS 115572 TaxID=1450535 RepID=A0A317WPA9_9EURO|nr:hypothetical protein BO94DRAFT_575218 [Aspergillus sclerotioniger CBS 115572]PWY87092.1 hypothetical protein BO94DRAFT_575218 [Aspergillus sclerotioniger CBS 115572]
MPLTHLPKETLLQIISLLPSPKDIASLSIQNHHLYSLCDMNTRKQFRRIRITNNATDLSRAFTFLIRILKQPSLGHYVRHIEFYDPWIHHGISGYEPNVSATLNEEYKDLIRAAIQTAGFPVEEIDRLVRIVAQVSLLRRRNPEERDWFRVTGPHAPRELLLAQTLTALIISTAPNLHSLSLTQPYGTENGMYWTETPLQDNHNPIQYPLEWLLYQINNNYHFPPKPLSNLKHIYLTTSASPTLWDENRFYFNLDLFGLMTHFHHLPAIEFLTTDLYRTDIYGKRGFPISTSNISTIKINHSSIADPDLIRIICSCKHLREFQYSIGGRAPDRDPTYTLSDYRRILQALLIHRNTLEMLDIDAGIPPEWSRGEFLHVSVSEEEEQNRALDDWEDEHEYLENEPSCILPAWVWGINGSLADFSALRKVALDVDFLLYMARGVGRDRDDGFRLGERVPLGLETLVVRGYEVGMGGVYDFHVHGLKGGMREEREEREEGGAGLGLGLREVRGIEMGEMIVPACHVEDPDRDGDLIWEREVEVWSEEEEEEGDGEGGLLGW